MRYPSVYSTKLSTGETIIVVTNWREHHYSEYFLTLSDIGIMPSLSETVKVRDIMEKKDLGAISDRNQHAKLLIDKIPGHGSKVLKFSIVPTISVF